MNFNKSIFGSLALMLLLTACYYEEGPVLSLSSRTSRIADTWKVVYATDEAGDETTDNYDGWSFTFTEDGDAEIDADIAGIGITYAGDWNLIDDDRNFQLLTKDPSGLLSFNIELEIIRLAGSEFWMRDPDDSLAVIYLEPK
ncbi:MAG: hypothetical protein OHK0039_01470 [Bacteroidia bacterium]